MGRFRSVFRLETQWNCSSPIWAVNVWPILVFLNRPHSELEQDKNCLRGKGLSTVLHILSVFVALAIQHARWMDVTVICGLSGVSNHIISKGTIFGIKLIEHKMCVWFSTQLECSWIS